MDCKSVPPVASDLTEHGAASRGQFPPAAGCALPAGPVESAATGQAGPTGAGSCIALPWKLFEDAGCANCHEPPVFSSFDYASAGIGKPENGRMDVTKKEEDKGKFRIPALRNVADTAPYFHDGRAATMKEALTRHDPNRLHGKIKDLTPKELADLIAYVLSL